MKTTYNDKQKERIYRWVEHNRDKHNELQMKTYWNKCYERKKYRMDRYYFLKECEIFRNILFI